MTTPARWVIVAAPVPTHIPKEPLHESIHGFVGLRQLRVHPRLVLSISMTYVIVRQGLHALHGKACICADPP